MLQSDPHMLNPSKSLSQRNFTRGGDSVGQTPVLINHEEENGTEKLEF